MRHRVAGRSFGRDKDHRQALFRNLVTELLRHERIETTQAKAKALRGDAEKLTTLAKRGGISARRLAGKTITDPDVTKKLFETVGPRYKERVGCEERDRNPQNLRKEQLGPSPHPS